MAIPHRQFCQKIVEAERTIYPAAERQHSCVACAKNGKAAPLGRGCRVVIKGGGDKVALKALVARAFVKSMLFLMIILCAVRFTLSCLKQVFRRSVLFCSPWKFGSSAGNGGMIGNTGRECRMPKRVMGNLALRPYSIRGYGIHRGLSVPVQLRHIQGDSGTTRRPLSALSRSRPCTGRKLHRLSMGGNLVTGPPRKKTK